MAADEDQTPTSVFVYGTLQRGQCREKCWPVPPLRIVPAFIQAHLYDLDEYPAITSGRDWVRGEIWHLDRESVLRTLDVLDEIEGYVPGAPNNLYERRVVPVYASPARSEPPIEHAFTYMMLLSRLPWIARRITANPHAAWPETTDGIRRTGSIEV